MMGPAAAAAAAAASLVLLLSAHPSQSFDLTILHTNDLHSRFDEVTARGSACRDKDRAAGKCFGGVARIKHAVDQIRREEDGVIFVNGGDFFQGTVWYSMFKWHIVANLTAPVGYTASSLGNHEFDDGVGDLVKFLDATAGAFPTLACNLDASAYPDLQRRLKGSLVVAMPSPTGGRDVLVGIVGYVTPETKDLASTGDVVFLDEVGAIRAEVERLRRKGVNIVVAVGHSGYETDLKIAEQVPGLDVIVGGHTNTFLWSEGEEPAKRGKLESSPSAAAGEYPTVVTQPGTGREVLVVQTSGFGKYLGKLKVTFDDWTGEVTGFSGNPVLLDSTVPKDPKLDKLVRLYAEEVAEKMEVVVGRSSEFIDGGRPKCRLEECAFGDLVTDAMAEEMGVNIAIINSGAIKGSFDQGDITMEDVIIAMPWANTVDVVTLPGSALKEILEHSVSNYDSSSADPGGRFLQFSGLVVTFDVRKDPGSRLVKAKIGRPEHPEKFEDIRDEREYKVSVLSFMVSGGDGYSMIPDNLIEHRNTGFLDNDLIVSYLKKHDAVRAPVAGRIVILDHAGRRRTSGQASHRDRLPSLGLVLLTAALLTRNRP